jgi:hypothetical protein
MGGLRTATGCAAPRWIATLAAVAGFMAAAWLPASASARFTDHEANTSVRVAHHFWHQLAPSVVERTTYNCGGRNVVLDWLRDLGSAMALADLWGCRQARPTIELERGTIRGLSDVGACGIITHEFGHLLGFAHSPRDRSVMSGSPSRGETAPRGATWERAWRYCGRRL